MIKLKGLSPEEVNNLIPNNLNPTTGLWTAQDGNKFIILLHPNLARYIRFVG